MKPKELRRKTEKEFRDLLREKRQKLGEMQFDLSAKKVKNVRQIRQLKKDIARLLTLLKENAN